MKVLPWNNVIHDLGGGWGLGGGAGGKGLKLALRVPHLRPQIHWGKNIYLFSLRGDLHLIHESLPATNKPQIKPIMKQR